ncbi:SGNH/GDSL hydrolase family protein [Streptomyces sp. FIT100]|uniref:SGNH/GDSL hydrolase family protein n=1 Tax=Streptomyces sp. FIT100 TaxID=2837956 RepID=UPI0021C59C29|nr:SGNH/GDSL hydrolase family protein [Streptomyces sp. FIT100]UUN26723.1 SGNH/GDSL hydrolase family protein [Streptomyces sp. FIT100]
MREKRRSGRTRLRPRSAVATLTAAGLVGLAALTGCDGQPGATRDGRQPPRPSPSPTPVWDRSPASVAAVGDSITRGFDACELLADCPEASWATGTDTAVRSLAQRLLGPASAAEHSWNHARTGARMADLPGQMTQAAARGPELVAVMVGANDACRARPELMTPVADFTRSFTAAMGALRRTAPKAQVYVSSVPDLMRLWSTGRGNPLGRQIWKLGICASMLGNAEDMSEVAQTRRARVHDRVVAYNEALKSVCAKDRLCRYDGGAVFDYRFTGRQLSHWDWFHPSKDGQSRLAEIAYRNVTSSRPPR